MAKKRSAKKSTKAAEIESELDFMQAMTFQILELKARSFALAQTMVSLSKALGVEPAKVQSAFETHRRAELQRLLEKAEEMNPELAAWLDERSLDDL